MGNGDRQLHGRYKTKHSNTYSLDTSNDGAIGRVERLDPGAGSAPGAVEDTLVVELEVELVKDGLVLGVDLGGRGVVQDSHGADDGLGGNGSEEGGPVEGQAVEQHGRHYEVGMRNE